MSNPPAGHKTIDIPTNSIGTVGRRSVDATGDPSGDPELSTTSRGPEGLVAAVTGRSIATCLRN